MNQYVNVARTTARSTDSVLATNKVIRNTYTLLSMTILFSALTAGFAMMTNAQPVHWLIMLVVFLGGPFVINALRNSAMGLVAIFAFTGTMGYILGPILSLYLALPNGSQIVTTAFGLTGVIFLGLSGYALVSRKNFSFMGGFLMVGFLVMLAAIVLNIFLEIPALSLAISAAMVLLLSAGILYETSAMVHGGETNYITMTVALYTSIFALLMHLLNLLQFFMGGDD